MFRKLSLCLVLGLMSAGSCGAARAADLVKVKVAITGATSDVVFWAAQKHGYFAKEGLDVDLIRFDSGAKMIAPLGSGQLDIATGGQSAGLFNAVARGIGIRIVADKSQTRPGFGTQSLLVRKDLIASGRYKTLADLKGMKFASPALGASAMTVLIKMLAKGGLTMKDIDPVYMANSQMAAAFANKALDAALPTEPGVSLALRTGDVQKVLEDYDVYPRHEIAVVLYSGKFSKEKPEAATAFLRAYLHGVRDYLEAIVQGRFTGPKGDEMVSLLTQFGPSKDPDFYRSFKVGYCDPDGRLHLKSLAEDLAAYKKANLIQGQVTLEQAVDTSFLEAALKQVGTYGKPLK